jgi:hypothetical protein
MASQSARDCSEAAGLVNSICKHCQPVFKRAKIGESYVINTKVVQRLSDLNLLGSVEESIGELLALSQGALNDLEGVDIAEEVGDGLVGVPGVDGSGVKRLVFGLACIGKTIRI